MTKPGKKKSWNDMTPAERLRKHASVLFEMPANEQMIGARDVVLKEALTEIANWMEAHEQWTKR